MYLEKPEQLVIWKGGVTKIMHLGIYTEEPMSFTKVKDVKFKMFDSKP